MREKGKFQALNPVLPDFYLEKLEERLETDPLMTGGLLELEQKPEEDCFCLIYHTCECNAECHDYHISCERYSR